MLARVGVIDPEVKKEYKVVLPLCNVCKENGKEHMKRAPIKRKDKTANLSGKKQKK